MNTRSIRSVSLAMGLITLNTTELFAQSNWVRKANMPTARLGLAAVVVDGKI